MNKRAMRQLLSIKSFTSLPEFRNALRLALGALEWTLLLHQWQMDEGEQNRRFATASEACCIIDIPAYLLLVCTDFGALAYLSHSWPRWRNLAHPRARRAAFAHLFLPAVLTYPLMVLN